MPSEIGHHTKRTNTVWLHFCEALSVVPTHRGGKESGSCHGLREVGRAAIVQRVLSCGFASCKVSEVDGGSGRTALGMYFMSLNWKMAKEGFL